MTNNVYSPYKVVHHREKIEQLKKGELISPIFAQIDLTNVCNLNCNFCFYRVNVFELGDWDPQGFIPTDVALKLLDELKEIGVEALEWTGGGSIECHPDWKKIIAKSKDLGFQNSIVTNGTLLDDEGLELIKDFAWVRFSFDTNNSETYKIIKGKDLFETALNNARKLIKMKDNNIIGFSFIICKDNYDEIVEATQLAKDNGFNNIRFSLAYTPLREKMFEGIWDKIVKNIEIAKGYEDDKFKVFAFSNRINELSSKTLSSYCGFHHFCAVISPTGIYPCCRLKDNDKFNLGKLGDNTFKEIWFGEKRKKFIEKIGNGCPYSCWMRDKNDFIKYLITDNPQHVNFI